MIVEKVERRWEVTVHGNERGSPTDIIVFNSIDGDPMAARVTISGQSAIVPLADLADALVKLQRHVSKSQESDA